MAAIGHSDILKLFYFKKNISVHCLYLSFKKELICVFFFNKKNAIQCTILKQTFDMGLKMGF